MRKFISFIVISLCILQTFSCNSNFFTEITNNISEIQNNYYYFEDENYAISLIMGQRESEYSLNGVSTPLKNYCVLMIEQTNFEQINQVKIKINNQIFDINPILNPYNNNYVYDLETSFKSISNISVCIKDDNSFILENKTNNFRINALNSLNIAIKEKKENLKGWFIKNKFNGEVFIRIIKIKSLDLFEYQILFVSKNYQTIQCLVNPITKKIEK